MNENSMLPNKLIKKKMTNFKDIMLIMLSLIRPAIVNYYMIHSTYVSQESNSENQCGTESFRGKEK